MPALPKPLHPTYAKMVVSALESLNDLTKPRSGTSRQMIEKYILSNYHLPNDQKASTYIKLALKRGVVSGKLKQVTGNGGNGSFKIANEVPKKLSIKGPKRLQKKPVAHSTAEGKPKTAKKRVAPKSTASTAKTAPKSVKNKLVAKSAAIEAKKAPKPAKEKGVLKSSVSTAKITTKTVKPAASTAKRDSEKVTKITSSTATKVPEKKKSKLFSKATGTIAIMTDSKKNNKVSDSFASTLQKT